MLRRYVPVLLLPLLAAAEPAPPPPLAEARGDLDGDGRPDRAHLERDGVLVIDDADGRERARVPLGTKQPILHGEVRVVSVEGHVLVHARPRLAAGAPSRRCSPPAARSRSSSGRPGRSATASDRSSCASTTAASCSTRPPRASSRCDGDGLLFPERWDFGSGRFRAVTDEAPAGKALRASPTAPSGARGPPPRPLPFPAASSDASGDRRADRLAAPREARGRSAATVWHAGFGAAARGAWATARAEAGTPSVRAVEIVAGKEAPEVGGAQVLGPAPAQRFTVELSPGVQSVTLPELVRTTCVTVAVAEPGARDNTLAEVRVFTDVDGPGGLDRLAADVAEMKPNADGAAHLLAERGVEAARVVDNVLPTAHGLGRRRLLQVLATIGSNESAPALGKALETAEPADRELVVGALGKMGAAGAKEAIRVYGDESQTEEARADAALVLGRLPKERAAIDALVAGAGKGAPSVRAATMASLARVYDEAGGAIEHALVDGGAPDRTGDLARALGLAARRFGARPEAAAALATAWARAPRLDDFALRLRLVRAMGDVGDTKLAGALAEGRAGRRSVVRAAAVSSAARVPGGAATVRAGASDADDRRAQRRRWRSPARGPGGLEPARTRARRGRLADGAPRRRRRAGAAVSRARRGARAARARRRRRRQDDGRRRFVGRSSARVLGRARPASTCRCRSSRRSSPRSASRSRSASWRRRSSPSTAAPTRPARSPPPSTTRSAIPRPTSGRSGGSRSPAHAGAGAHRRHLAPGAQALSAAANEPLSPAVRAAAMDTIGRLCPDGAAPALNKGANDADSAVQRAALAALERCHR